MDDLIVRGVVGQVEPKAKLWHCHDVKYIVIKRNL